MSITRTIIVLGAGASVPVGYPTGDQLVTEICEGLKSGGSIKADGLYEQARGAHFTDSEISDFRGRLDHSTVTSIDEFLRHNPDDRDIAKFCIAHQLFVREDADKLTAAGKKCWYGALIRIIGTGLADLHRADLTIVTFNYDRSLQQFFHRSYSSIHRNSASEIENALSGIQFINVHGSIGDLPWQNRKTGRLYRYPQHPAEIREASKGIRVVDETVSIHERHGPIAHHMMTAKRIIFLGFGFHRENLKKLQLSRLEDGHKVEIIGTVRGMNRNRISELQKTLNLQHFQEIDQVLEGGFMTIRSRNDQAKFILTLRLGHPAVTRSNLENVSGNVKTS